MNCSSDEQVPPRRDSSRPCFVTAEAKETREEKKKIIKIKKFERQKAVFQTQRYHPMIPLPRLCSRPLGSGGERPLTGRKTRKWSKQ